MNKQAEHYEKIHEEYQYHYFDKFSKFYRRIVIFEKIIEIIEKSKSTLEVGCGGRENLNELLSMSDNIKVYHGVDISKKAINLFNKNVEKNFKGFLGDFTRNDFSLKSKYNCLIFFGSLHHMTQNLEIVLRNSRKLLMDDGKIIFIEPNAAFLNTIRNIWYRISDKFDHENERALNIEEIQSLCEKNYFSNELINFGGNIGFFLIYNSMILRTPKWLKYLLYKPLTYFDLILQKLNNKYMSAFHISVWKKEKVK